MSSLDFDVIVHVYHSQEDRLIGHASKYTTIPHPGTNKIIEGWKWDERIWPTEGESRAVSYAPSIWDPTFSGIEEDLLQSGYGDNDDLLLLDIEEVSTSGTNVWAPSLQHGYFYIRDEEWYLYSDSYLTEYFTATGIEDGHQVLTLSEPYKPTIPIQVRNFYFNHLNARYEVYKDFRKKVEFSDEPTSPEFILDTTYSPPKIILDGNYSEEIGCSIVLSGIYADPTDIDSLDMVGVSNGDPNQEFPLRYSPLDPSQDIEVWTWFSSSVPTQWAVIDPLDQFVSSGMQVKVDKDKGILTFGDYDSITMTGSGMIPPVASRIGAYYTVTPAVLYEPMGTQDTILAYGDNANINPVKASTSNGFVQITTESTDPASIILTSDLPSILGTYVIDLGNNIGYMTATVKGINGDVLESQDVTFEILDPKIGTFGAVAQEIVSLTNSDGEAVAIYNSPLTIQNLGNASISVTYEDRNTLIEFQGIVEPSTVSGIFLYKVHESDDVLGIAESDHDTYYQDYLDEEGMVSGVQGTIPFEEEYRTFHEFGKPVEYSALDLSTGKKTMMLTTRTGTMNPHTGYIEPDIYVPLFPSSMENIGTDLDPILRLTYSGILDLPGSSGTKAYFAVGNALTRIRAYVTNRKTNRRIYSNTVNLEVQIPDTLNGVFYCNVLNDIPDGLLTKVRNVNDLTDEQINTSSGIDDNWNSYINERLPEYVPIITVYVRARVDSIASETTGYIDFYGSGSPVSRTFVPTLGWTTYSFVFSKTEVDTIFSSWPLDEIDVDIRRENPSLPTVQFDVSWVQVVVSTLVYGNSSILKEVVPEDDIAGGGSWNTVGGSGIYKYTRINETTPDDSNYIYTTSSTGYTFRLGDLSCSTVESYVEWFKRTRKGDVVGMNLASLSGLQDVEPFDAPAEIPLGFRLKSSSITIASILDQVTFLDPNDPLPVDYFDV